MADKTLTVAFETSPEFEQAMRDLVQRTCAEAAITFGKGFEAHIRSMVYDIMRERDIRLASS